MKDYNSYLLADYLQDSEFRSWVLADGYHDPHTAWYHRLASDKKQAQTAKEAQEIILASQVAERPVEAAYAQDIIRNTLQAIRSQDNQTKIRYRNWLFPFSVAASVAAIMIGAWLFYFSDQHLQGDRMVTVDHANTSGAYRPIALPDGSTVLLYPGSSLRFPVDLAIEQREVYLEGKAFFEVAKDANRPFLVHSQEMVTRVLGTSFLIDAFEAETNFEVVVKSGKVSVSTEAKAGLKSPAMSLEPNQRLVLKRKDQMMIRSEVAAPQVAKMSPNNIQPLVFRDIAIDSILAVLGSRYNVQFFVEGTNLSDCALTTTFSDEPLFEKLKIICQAIGPSTHYRTEGNQIIINSKGCNN